MPNSLGIIGWIGAVVFGLIGLEYSIVAVNNGPEAFSAVSNLIGLTCHVSLAYYTGWKFAPRRGFGIGPKIWALVFSLPTFLVVAIYPKLPAFRRVPAAPFSQTEWGG